MELKKMLVGLEGLKVKGNLEIEIEGLESNSKNVKKGYLFIAIKGFSTDGHQYVESAIENGATAIMIEEGCDLKKLKIPEDITVIMAKNTREEREKSNIYLKENGNLTTQKTNITVRKHNFYGK